MEERKKRVAKLRKNVPMYLEDYQLAWHAKELYREYLGRERLCWSDFIRELTLGVIPLLEKKLKEERSERN